jgi:hypothetical protein
MRATERLILLDRRRKEVRSRLPRMLAQIREQRSKEGASAAGGHVGVIGERASLFHARRLA